MNQGKEMDSRGDIEVFGLGKEKITEEEMNQEVGCDRIGLIDHNCGLPDISYL
jgi:hypothetical protein